MVKKLLKYEAQYYLRAMLPISVILLGMAVITRIIQLFENDTSTYGILFWSSAILLGIVCATCLIMSVVFVISRFYKNLFTDEGYLSLVLPVTENQHIFGKLIAAVLNMICAIVLVAAALMIATSGDMMHEIFKAVGYVGKYAAEEAGTVNFIFYIVELVLLFVAALAGGSLLFYSCTALGQLAKKNRIAKAFLVYFIYYIITQILGTAFIIIVNNKPDLFSHLLSWAADHPEAAVHCGICGSIVITLVLGLIFFLITRHVLKNKLNLE